MRPGENPYLKTPQQYVASQRNVANAFDGSPTMWTTASNRTFALTRDQIDAYRSTADVETQYDPVRRAYIQRSRLFLPGGPVVIDELVDAQQVTQPRSPGWETDPKSWTELLRARQREAEEKDTAKKKRDDAEQRLIEDAKRNGTLLDLIAEHTMAKRGAA